MIQIGSMTLSHHDRSSSDSSSAVLATLRATHEEVTTSVAAELEPAGLTTRSSTRLGRNSAPMIPRSVATPPAEAASRNNSAELRICLVLVGVGDALEPEDPPLKRRTLGVAKQ